MNLLEIIKSDRPTVVNFHATWCGPCHMMKPNLDEVVVKFGEKIFYERIDVDQNRELVDMFNIRSLPTTVIFKNGEVRWKQSGIFPALEIIRLVEENL